MKRTALLFAIASGLSVFALLLGFAPPRPGPTKPADLVVLPQSTSGTLKLTAALANPVLPAGSVQETFLKIDLDAIALPTRARAPVNLALVLDRSGSMSGDKLDNARKAARQLVSQLDDKDRFALVTFGSDVTTLVNSVRCTADAKQRIYDAIDGIYEVGGTNISGGVEAGLAEISPFRTQFGVNRVILLSDGQANEGIVTNDGLSELARRVNGDGITLSTIGVGLEFNEQVMEAMAEYGSGTYHFLSDPQQMASLFDGELKQAVNTVASQPVLQIIPVGRSSVAEVYGFLTEGPVTSPTVRLPDFSAGQHRSVIVRLLAGPDTMESNVTAPVVQLKLAYTDVANGRVPATGGLQLTARTSHDPQELEAAADANVRAAALQTQALWMMHTASTDYANGERGLAEKKIREARASLQKGRQYADLPGFEEADNEAKAFEQTLNAPEASPEAASGSAKRLHDFSTFAR